MISFQSATISVLSPQASVSLLLVYLRHRKKNNWCGHKLHPNYAHPLHLTPCLGKIRSFKHTLQATLCYKNTFRGNILFYVRVKLFDSSSGEHFGLIGQPVLVVELNRQCSCNGSGQIWSWPLQLLETSKKCFFSLSQRGTTVGQSVAHGLDQRLGVHMWIYIRIHNYVSVNTLQGCIQDFFLVTPISNYFLGPWPPFIISLPYEHVHLQLAICL